jgi:rare lipoprotein A
MALLGLAIPAHAASWSGKASYYRYHGRTASGRHMGAFTAAHRTLPFGTRVKVTNLANHRSVVVRVNDRGPFTRGRIIDVSQAAADALGMRQAGIAHVRLDLVSE